TPEDRGLRTIPPLPQRDGEDTNCERETTPALGKVLRSQVPCIPGERSQQLGIAPLPEETVVAKHLTRKQLRLDQQDRQRRQPSDQSHRRSKDETPAPGGDSQEEDRRQQQRRNF